MKASGDRVYFCSFDRENDVINFTPNSFVELVVLGLYWEFWNQGRGKSCTTVSHILKVLKDLEIISEEEIKLVQDNIRGQPYQRKLYHHCSVVVGGVNKFDCDSWVSCRQNLSANHRRFLQTFVLDQKIWLLPAGARAAEYFAEVHKNTLKKEMYLSEVARLAIFQRPA